MKVLKYELLEEKKIGKIRFLNNVILIDFIDYE